MLFENVNAEALANIYFDGEVASHSLVTKEGDKITIGIIYPEVIILIRNQLKEWK